jgi:hypothetical protein
MLPEKVSISKKNEEKKEEEKKDGEAALNKNEGYW